MVQPLWLWHSMKKARYSKTFYGHRPMICIYTNFVSLYLSHVSLFCKLSFRNFNYELNFCS